MARVATLITDSVVLAMTVMKTWRVRKAANRFGMLQTLTMLDFITKNGMKYYVVMVTLNILALRLNSYRGLVVLVPSWITNITSILISRFILDIRNHFTEDPNFMKLPVREYHHDIMFPRFLPTLMLDPTLVGFVGLEEEHEEHEQHESYSCQHDHHTRTDWYAMQYTTARPPPAV
ncbi:hypothetical protein C8Q75DRAFT_804266 [Abortiporus biennis]|nr:hypothetical protein C8Q75DRAFT_804266 [Abortiporus biennis]